MGPGIAREPVRDDGLVGTFFAPADGTARPGVLVVGGSDGGLSEGMAALLASHGFAVLALVRLKASPARRAARSERNGTVSRRNA